MTQKQVDQAVGRVQQEHPADRKQNVRDHHRDDGDDPEQKFEGDVRTCVQIGQEKCQSGGHHRGSEYEDDRVDDDPGQFGVGVCLDVLVQGEFAKGSQARGKAPEDQHDYGTHGQETNDGDQGRRQDRSFVDHCSFPFLPGDQQTMVGINGEIGGIPHLDVRVRLGLDEEPGVINDDIAFVCLADENQ